MPIEEVYDFFSDPYWRVRHSDQDWEELNCQGKRQEKGLAPATAYTVCLTGRSGREGGRDGEKLGRRGP